MSDATPCSEKANENMDPNTPKKRKPRGKPSDAKIAERRIEAMRFRASGLNYRLIAVKLNISLGQAYADVQAGLQAARHDLLQRGAGLIALELERLEQPVMKLVQLLNGGNLNVSELCEVVDTIRKLSESRRKLLGLDAPNKQAVAGKGGCKIEATVTLSENDHREALIELRETLASVPGATEALAAFMNTRISGQIEAQN